MFDFSRLFYTIKDTIQLTFSLENAKITIIYYKYFLEEEAIFWETAEKVYKDYCKLYQ